MDYKEIYTHQITEDNEEGLVVKWSSNGDEEFENGAALTVLLIERQVFLNNNWWRKEWEEEHRELFSINVNCSDVFAWGCADSEGLLFKELEDLFNHYEKDKQWGVAIWCIKKRSMFPQKPVYDSIQKEGIWNLDEMELEPGVDGNFKENKCLN